MFGQFGTHEFYWCVALLLPHEMEKVCCCVPDGSGMYVQLSDDLGWKIDVKTVLLVPIVTDRSLTLWTDRSFHPTDMDMHRCLLLPC